MEEDGLKSIPLGQLMEMRKNGKEIKGLQTHSPKDLKVKKEGKRDKHAPQEISSKKPIHRKRVVENQRVVRDPRFDNLSGKFNYDLFRKSYKFIENQQDEEIKEMRDTMFQQEDETDKRNIQSNLTRIMQQKIDRERQDRKTERKREHMKAEKEAIKKGKKPFFLKKRDLREAELRDRFESLSKRGKLNKYMEKKRKRNARRDEVNMPEIRQQEE